MLGGAAATHVKLEASDAEKYLESLSTVSQLSTLEVKSEFKQYASVPLHPQGYITPKSCNSILLNGINSNASIRLDR